jgi:hypothetical protein
MAKNVVRTATSYVFFGDHLCQQSSVSFLPAVLPVADVMIANDPIFLDAALQYPESIFMAAEALRYVPEFLAP